MVVEAGSELGLGVGGRGEGCAPSLVFEDFESSAGIVGDGVDWLVGVFAT